MTKMTPKTPTPFQVFVSLFVPMSVGIALMSYGAWSAMQRPISGAHNGPAPQIVTATQPGFEDRFKANCLDILKPDWFKGEPLMGFAFWCRYTDPSPPLITPRRMSMFDQRASSVKAAVQPHGSRTLGTHRGPRGPPLTRAKKIFRLPRLMTARSAQTSFRQNLRYWIPKVENPLKYPFSRAEVARHHARVRHRWRIA